MPKSKLYDTRFDGELKKGRRSVMITFKNQKGGSGVQTSQLDKDQSYIEKVREAQDEWKNKDEGVTWIVSNVIKLDE